MPSLSTLYDKFIRRATLTTQDKADILGDIGGQPLDSDLTDYANAADAAARRALIGVIDPRIATISANYTVTTADNGCSFLHTGGIITLPASPSSPIRFLVKSSNVTFLCGADFKIKDGTDAIFNVATGSGAYGFAGSTQRFVNCSYFGNEWLIYPTA